MQTRWTITVPATLNDGTPTPLDAIEHIEARIAAIGGGFTATAGEGVWRDPKSGIVYREPITVYTFDVTHIADGQVKRLASDIAQLLDQDAVYASRQDVSTYLVEAGWLAGARHV